VLQIFHGDTENAVIHHFIKVFFERIGGHLALFGVPKLHTAATSESRQGLDAGYALSYASF